MHLSYAPELLEGEYSRNVGPGIDSWAEHQALGVPQRTLCAMRIPIELTTCTDYTLTG